MVFGFNLVLDTCDPISMVSNLEQAKKRTAELIAKAHRHVYTYISDPSNGYVEVSRFLVHTPDQVSIIIGLVCNLVSFKFEYFN